MLRIIIQIVEINFYVWGLELQYWIGISRYGVVNIILAAAIHIWELCFVEIGED